MDKNNPILGDSWKPAPAGEEPLDEDRFDSAPCYICGYDGPGYYQPKTHPCAARYHADPTPPAAMDELTQQAQELGMGYQAAQEKGNPNEEAKTETRQGVQDDTTRTRVAKRSMGEATSQETNQKRQLGINIEVCCCRKPIRPSSGKCKICNLPLELPATPTPTDEPSGETELIDNLIGISMYLSNDSNSGDMCVCVDDTIKELCRSQSANAALRESLRQLMNAASAFQNSAAENSTPRWGRELDATLSAASALLSEAEKTKGSAK